MIGGTISPHIRNFPVVINDGEETTVCPHLDLSNGPPYGLQMYFFEQVDIFTTKIHLKAFFEKKLQHRFVPQKNNASTAICNGKCRVLTTLLVEVLINVNAITPFRLFACQYGQKHLWTSFQSMYQDVFVSNPNNLWDLTMSMRHDKGRIIMFRNKRKRKRKTKSESNSLLVAQIHYVTLIESTFKLTITDLMSDIDMVW